MRRPVVTAITALGLVALLVVGAIVAVRMTGEPTATVADAAPSADDAPPEEASAGASQAADTPDGGLDDDAMRALLRCVRPAGAPGSRDVPDGTSGEQIAAIADTVEELRARTFVAQPTPAFLDDAQLRRRLTRIIRQEYDAATADADQRVLVALGAVPPGTDLQALQTDLLAAQVAGFYDPDTEELVVRGTADGGLAPAAQSTLAHELQHALADQALGLPVDVTEDVADGDAGLAALALIEGDATLLQQQFTVAGLTPSEQLRLTADPDALAAQRQLAGVPHYIAQSLQFPYIAGLNFACARYLDGGWAAVDAAYDRLPTTSAEIMDPARYGTAATDPEDPGAPGGDWRRRRTTTMGAADLWWLFEAPGGETGRALDASRAAALDWTGGELGLWTDGEATAVGVALTQRDGGALCDAVTTWYERAFPEATDAPTRRTERLVREGTDQTAVVICDGMAVRLGIGPDLRTARALAR